MTTFYSIDMARLQTFKILSSRLNFERFQVCQENIKTSIEQEVLVFSNNSSHTRCHLSKFRVESFQKKSFFRRWTWAFLNKDNSQLCSFIWLKWLFTSVVFGSFGSWQQSLMRNVISSSFCWLRIFCMVQSSWNVDKPLEWLNLFSYLYVHYIFLIMRQITTNFLMKQQKQAVRIDISKRPRIFRQFA